MSHPTGKNDEDFGRAESSRLDAEDPACDGRADGINRNHAPFGDETVSALPEEVKGFLEANIDSVDQLEILRVLGEDPHKEWRAVDLAGETQTAPANIAAHLALLQARGLLHLQTRDSDLICRYAPTSALAERAAQLLQVYRERPVTMIKLVYARARDPLKTFADAFRLKKES